MVQNANLNNMKDTLNNLLWVILILLVVFLICLKMDSCIQSVANIENILKSGEIIEYEIN